MHTVFERWKNVLEEVPAKNNKNNNASLKNI